MKSPGTYSLSTPWQEMWVSLQVQGKTLALLLSFGQGRTLVCGSRLCQAFSPFWLGTGIPRGPWCHSSAAKSEHYIRCYPTVNSTNGQNQMDKNQDVWFWSLVQLQICFVTWIYIWKGVFYHLQSALGKLALVGERWQASVIWQPWGLLPWLCPLQHCSCHWKCLCSSVNMVHRQQCRCKLYLIIKEKNRDILRDLYPHNYFSVLK